MELDVLKYFNKYFDFVRLIENSESYKLYSIAMDDSFFKQQRKYIEKRELNLPIVFEDSFLKLKPTYNLRNKLKKNNEILKLNKAVLNKNRTSEIKSEKELLEYLIKKGTPNLIKKGDDKKFIIALSILGIVLDLEDRVTFLYYPLEYLELDELNSAKLALFEKGKAFFDEDITLDYSDIKIIQNDLIFKKFLPDFVIKKPEDDYADISYLMNKDISKVTPKEIREFFIKRKHELRDKLKSDKNIAAINVFGFDDFDDNGFLFVIKENMQVNLDNIINQKVSISNPLKKYLQKDLKVKKEFNFYYGTNTKEYPLSKGQADVVMSDEELVTVIGAPGTGKTTLFKSIIANSITKRALNLIEGKKDYNNLMLITSTARKAIYNVIEDIEKDNPFMGSLMNLSNLDKKEENRRSRAVEVLNLTMQEVYEKGYFNSKEFVEFYEKYKDKKFIEVYEEYVKRKITDELQDGNLKGFSFEVSEINIKVLKELIKRVKHEIDEIVLLFKQKELLSIDVNELEKLENDLQKELKEFEDSLEEVIYIFGLEDKRDKNIKSYKEFFLSDLTDKLDKYEKSKKKIENANLIGRMLNSIFKKEEKLLKKYKKEFNLLNLTDDEFLDVIKKIKKVRKQYNYYLKVYERINEIAEKIEKHNNYISLLNKFGVLKIKDKDGKIRSVSLKEEIKKYSDIESFYRLSPTIYMRNYLLYRLSEAFLILDIYKRYDIDEIVDSLEKFKKIVFLEDYKNEIEEKEYEEILLIGSRFYPVIGATNKKISISYSSKKIRDFHKFYHTILVDEAGMIVSANIIHSLNIGKRAFIVGDPKQLKPISDIPEILQDEYLQFMISQNPKYQEYERFLSPLKYSAYDVASKTSNRDDFIGISYLLDEHRRCQEEIARLFIEVAEYPDDLKIKTPKKDPIKFKSDNKASYLRFYNCKLATKPKLKNTNELEIEAIKEILDELKDSGVDLSKDVGIITPFANQAGLLIKEFGDRLEHTNKSPKIGTVHKFQGAEFDVVIFSSVVNDFYNNQEFVQDNVNLLNVSISRAKKLYIHVGDYEVLKKANKKPMNRYLNYFDKYSIKTNFAEIKLKELVDYSLNEEDELLKRLKKDCFSKVYYDADDIAKKMCELISNAKESILFVVPWSAEYGLEYIKKNVDLSNIKNRVKVTFAGYYDEKAKKEKEKLINLMKDIFGERIYIRNFQTHEKVLIVDRKYFFVGSFNFLSNPVLNFRNSNKKEYAILMGEYYAWEYLLKRSKELGVERKRVIEELDKFVNKSL